jgi:hypothetical protein
MNGAQWHEKIAPLSVTGRSDPKSEHFSEIMPRAVKFLTCTLGLVDVYIWA